MYHSDVITGKKMLIVNFNCAPTPLPVLRNKSEVTFTLNNNTHNGMSYMTKTQNNLNTHLVECP